MSPVAVLERSQPLSDAPRHYVKRADAKYLEAQGLARRISKNLIQLLVALKKGLQHPVNALIRCRKKADQGGLLEPLDFYLPANYPLPYSLLRHYERSL